MATPNSPRTIWLVSARNVALTTAFVVVLTVVAVWLFGLGQHRTLFANSLISTSILLAAFVVFTSAGLYHGVKLRDDVGRLTDRINRRNFPNSDVSGFDFGDFDFHFDGDGLVSFLVALFAWVVAAVLALCLVWLLGALLWTSMIAFAAILYWVFFRALRLVFKNSNRCRSQWLPSIKLALAYSVLYTAWIYAIIYAAHSFH